MMIAIRHDHPMSRVQAHGKQVLWEGQHMTDAIDERTAEFIAISIAYLGMHHEELPRDVQIKIEEFCR